MIDLTPEKIHQASVIAERFPGVERDRFLVKLTGSTQHTTCLKRGKRRKKLSDPARRLLAQLEQMAVIRLEPPSALYDYERVFPATPVNPIPEPDMTPEIAEVAADTSEVPVYERVLQAIKDAEAAAILHGTFKMPSKHEIADRAGAGKAYLSQSSETALNALKAYNQAQARLDQKRTPEGQKSPQEDGVSSEPSNPAPERDGEAATLPDVGVVVQLEERIYQLQQQVKDALAAQEVATLQLERAGQEVERLLGRNTELESVVDDLKAQVEKLSNRIANLQEYGSGGSLSELIETHIAQEERKISECTRRLDEYQAAISQLEANKEAAAHNLATWRRLLTQIQPGPVATQNGHCAGAVTP